MTRAAVLGIVFLVLTGASEAAAKTPVTVKFVLKAYDGQFDTAEVETIQRQVTEQIAARLGEHARFLEYVTQDGNAFIVTATLQPRLASERSGAPGEVVFHFKLEGPRVQANPEFVVFRPANDIGSIPGVEGFVKEIDLRLSEQIYRNQLRPLLLRVPIATTGKLLSSPAAGWLLPYGRVEICLDPDSQLGIEHTVQITGGVLRPKLFAHADGDFEGHILGRPVNPSEFQQQLGTLPADQVSIGSIWVTEYRDLVPCSNAFQK